MEIAFYILVGAVVALSFLALSSIVVIAVVSKPLMAAAMRIGASVDLPGARADGEFSLEAANDQFYDVTGQDAILAGPTDAIDASPELQNALGTELPFTESWAKEDPRDGYQAPQNLEDGHFSVPAPETRKPCATCAKVRAALKRALAPPRRGSLHTGSADSSGKKKRNPGGSRGD